ncbi:EAL domain-containing protein [Paraburkholderia kirstenboschensis]|uniref:cyclic-guanylate-specific phosphodiesterase n=1 Tax=Paraburkholderia kirstenboschensis TaxID=1245436 RepID=A0ABZ0EAR5_9BURK|nr:EAL domain-containing protein [Paraburkholderia kirstenboschensis]WOD13595.1 EAL domain-containing protein [Paraburkholderia kirstenboschensis]
MADATKAVDMGSSRPVRTATIFRRAAPRLSLALAVGGGALMMLVAIVLGEQHADRAVNHHGQLIGNDLLLSVDRILDGVVSRRRTELAALAGQPCAEVARSLAELETHLRYVRAVALVFNGRLYCSSALGPIDRPLSAYLTSSARSDSIGLLAQTPYQPGEPVIVMYSPAGKGAGVLYVVEGDYLADALAHGIRLGAETAALSMAGIGILNDHGRFLSASASQAAYATRVTSHAWPFAVLVSSSEGFTSGTRLKYRLAYGAVGLLLAALIVAAYLVASAPRRVLLSAVRHALRRGEFQVVYQPIIATVTRSVVGVEALLRWHHPKWGAISPAVFMAEVESSELLPAVTQFVLRTSVAEMTLCPPTIPLRIAVNVAPKDLERKGFVAEVEALNEKLPADSSLVLELTERFLLSESARTAAVFQALKAKGIKFAIDDFGTQHSNLDVLDRFPFDYVKIDRQFVNQIDTGGAHLINGIVSVARHFGLQVIAEGVETEGQHQALLLAGVPFAQGYLYQRPVPAGKLVSIATAGNA